MVNYPKKHGKVCEHRGSNLYYRTLEILKGRADSGIARDNYRVERLLKRMPALYLRCLYNDRRRR